MKRFSLLSNSLGKAIRLKLSVAGMRTVEHCMGIDNYLLSQPLSKLSPEARVLRRKILKRAKSTELTDVRTVEAPSVSDS